MAGKCAHMERSVRPLDRGARLERLAVLILLGIQTILLAYSATTHSPTQLEPAFLASGISHWKFGRFELYRVNPPLVRMVAALPVMAAGCETDWSRFYDGPGSRAEFPIGEDFIKANGPASIPLFFYARFACIPFTLIGGYFSYRWAKELYGGGAGLVTLVLYTFEPNLLAHGELITPDGACTAFGIMAGYAFWSWLKQPTWKRAFLAGGALGLAELTKISWLILFALWPMMWLMWRWMEPGSFEGQGLGVKGQAELDNTLPSSSRNSTFKIQLIHLVTILLLTLYIINLCYVFDGFGTQLKEFQFVSTTLTGLDKAGTPGNRFAGYWLGELPIPLPKQYILGFDSQKKDLEEYSQKSYLLGEWKEGGWWYYYLYGLLVKVPSGTWCLFGFVVLARLFRWSRSFSTAPDETIKESEWATSLRDELILLVPGLVLLCLVSSQTEFNIHLRYVFPSLGILLIFIGQAGVYCCQPTTPSLK